MKRRPLLLGLCGVGGGLISSGPLRSAHAQWATGNDEQSRELELRRSESLLLHRKIDLGGLRLLRDGRLVNSETLPVARLLLVHIWAVECRPCVEEFPILRRITDSLRELPQVTTILVCETRELQQIRGFLDSHRGDMPRVDHYQSLDDRLRRSLQNRAQPTTLLLDTLHVVRQAFLGSLKQRRSEFADAISRLSRTI
jgi:hypothetical protein